MWINYVAASLHNQVYVPIMFVASPRFRDHQRKIKIMETHFAEHDKRNLTDCVWCAGRTANLKNKEKSEKRKMQPPKVILGRIADIMEGSKREKRKLKRKFRIQSSTETEPKKSLMETVGLI